MILLRILLAVAGFVGGAIGGYFLCFLILVIGVELLGWDDMNGGLSMGVAFGIAPLVGFLVGIGTAVWIMVRPRRDSSTVEKDV